MSLTGFFQKIRDVETAILETFPIIVSLATPDGGKEGAMVETPRRIAARMIVQGLARLAEEAEATLFRAAQAEATKLAEQTAAAAKVQLTVLTAAELNKLKSGTGAPKD